MFLVNFGPFLVQSGVSDVTKGPRLLNFERLTSPLAFSSQKKYPRQFLDQKNHFIMFYCVFGQFRAILGAIQRRWRHKGVKIFKLGNSDVTIGFLVPRNVPAPIFGAKNHCIVFYWFWLIFTILGTIDGQWRHEGGQDFRILKFCHHHRLSRAKKCSHVNF